MLRTLSRALLPILAACLMFSLWSAPAFPSPLVCRKSHTYQVLLQRAYQEFLKRASTIDDTPNRRFFYTYLHKEKATPQGAVERLNATAMGLLGEVFSFEYSPENKKVGLVKNEVRASLHRREVESNIQNISPEEVLTAKKVIEQSLPVLYSDSGNIIVKASLVSRQHLQGFEKALLHRYQSMGMKVVDFVYRFSGLEARRPLTGATMLDEVRSIIKEGRGYNIHLTFDPKVWELELKLIANFQLRYFQAGTEQEKARVLAELSWGNGPFLPFAGVVTTDLFLPNGKPTEIKRYFSNPFEDPLGFVQLTEKNEYQMRLKMLLDVVGGLDESVELEIHAHSVIHRRAYTKLGFAVFSESENPLYPGVKVYILRGQKNFVLSKLSEALKRAQAGD